MPQEKNKINPVPANKKARLSIICPVLNVEKYIGETIDSVLRQTYKDWELLIMDGVSKDKTLKIIEEYTKKYPNIKLYSSRDECMYHAFEKGLKISRGEFICFLGGQDCFFDKEWLAKGMTALENNPDISLSWALGFSRTEDGNIIGTNESYTNFIEPRNGLDILGIIIKKIFKFFKDLVLADWKKRKILFSRIFSKTAPLRIRSFIQPSFASGNFPQREDWFLYWLKTGLCFPDQAMIVSKNVYLKCTNRYIEGSNNMDEMVNFFFNFNANGYLAYYVPLYAILGMIHAGSGSDTRVLENNESLKKYLVRVADFRKRVLVNHEEVNFRDRNGKNLYVRKF